MTTKWTAADLPDLNRRTVVVTGATSGIGLVTARELARAGARVVLAVRDTAKGERAAADMPGRTEVRELDVSSMRSVRAFARAWTGPLDVLVNNAGIMQVPESHTEEGFELQSATNHLGPFALTNLLLPHITDRVVTVASQLHRLGKPVFDDLDWTRREYDDLQAYNDSKLAAVLFALELDRRMTGPRRSVVAHPGIATTSLTSHVRRGPSARIGRMSFLLNDAEHGALPTLYAATQDVAGGSYVGPDGIGGIKGHPALGKPSRTARDEGLARELWELSGRLTRTGTELAV
ncbi:oxidoreductase [Umezawaea tangerina]|uniref:NAD(P)-dependent dehydrogenase (Short-subunit alcohol dehydrogenase family) n=1 Tax=Umezawaea tangerina TaxID=84725 RepID=A0A2T0SYY5_9PSEU|nr:oxidoreductase [Umezawaea tangerina]PRY38625.1 NAD(P)-dependent dehydrogenase (short-subunit alcohol dehydrogenase family) [Umezawaea tangerina]